MHEQTQSYFVHALALGKRECLTHEAAESPTQGVGLRADKAPKFGQFQHVTPFGRKECLT